MSSNSSSSFPVASSIRQKLNDGLGLKSIIHLDIINESHMHNVYVKNISNEIFDSPNM